MKQAKPIVRVAGCFVFNKDKFVILHRHPDKPEGLTWDIPAGKTDAGESDITAMKRELFEETGHTASEEELKLLGCYRFEKKDIFLDFVTYRLDLSEKINVRLSHTEHVDHKWVTAEECYAMSPLTGIFHQLLEATGLMPVSHETMLR